MSSLGIILQLKQSHDRTVFRELNQYIKLDTKLAVAKASVQFLDGCILHCEYPKYFWKVLKRNGIKPTKAALKQHALAERDIVTSRINELESKRSTLSVALENLSAEECEQFESYVHRIGVQQAELRVASLQKRIKPTRVTQLKQGDTERQTQQRLQISRLQRELREVKDRAEALELQVPIMRRRLIEAQEHQTQPYVPASQTPMTLAASEKERMRLAKQLRQTKEEANKLREEIVLLKARQLESSQEKLIGVSHQRALRSAQARADELSRACEEHKRKAREAENELNHCKNEYSSELNRVREQLDQLDRELRSTRQALESSRHSEEELLAFRALVARQLGLRYENLAVPDYEIIDQLGRLISLNQAQTANLATTESAMNLLGEKH